MGERRVAHTWICPLEYYGVHSLQPKLPACQAALHLGVCPTRSLQQNVLSLTGIASTHATFSILRCHAACSCWLVDSHPSRRARVGLCWGPLCSSQISPSCCLVVSSKGLKTMSSRQGRRAQRHKTPVRGAHDWTLHGGRGQDAPSRCIPGPARGRARVMCSHKRPPHRCLIVSKKGVCMLAVSAETRHGLRKKKK